MDKYNELVRIEKLKDYRYKENCNNIDISTGTIDLNSDLKELLLKCFSDNEIKMHLLKYELINKKFELICDNLSLIEFEEKALQIIERYHWKAGGWKIEDSEFIIHRFKDLPKGLSKDLSKDYDINKNEIIFENTIDRSDLNDEETEFYCSIRLHPEQRVFGE